MTNITPMTTTRKLKKNNLSKPHVWLACRIDMRVAEYTDVFWEILGVYTSRKKAIARCKTLDDWIVALPLDQDLPDEGIVFDTEFFPLEWDEENKCCVLKEEC